MLCSTWSNLKWIADFYVSSIRAVPLYHFVRNQHTIHHISCPWGLDVSFRAMIYTLSLLLQSGMRYYVILKGVITTPNWYFLPWEKDFQNQDTKFPLGFYSFLPICTWPLSWIYCFRYDSLLRQQEIWPSHANTGLCKVKLNNYVERKLDRGQPAACMPNPRTDAVYRQTPLKIVSKLLIIHFWT